MSITPAELWQKITTHSLALPDQCRQWANDLSRKQGAAAALQTDQIVSYLLSQNLLTAYQLEQLVNAADPLLKVGPWRIEDRIATRPFTQWYVGNDVARNRKRWLFLVNPTLLQRPDVRVAGPSLEWNKIHSAIKLTDGWNFEPPEKQGTQLVVQAHPLEGELARPRSAPPAQIGRWILQLARSLNELHQNRLIHGHVRPDRLWIDAQGKPLLLRDPLIPPNTTSTTDAWSPLDQRLEPASRAHFMAPELSVPGQYWSASADIYSLGCLWYWLIQGKAPFQDAPLNQVAVLHAVNQLYVSEADIGGSRLAECFKFCIAKNPMSRFSQAGALVAALEVALSKPDAPTSKPTDKTTSIPKVTPAAAHEPAPLPSKPAKPTSSPPAVAKTDPPKVIPSTPLDSETIVFAPNELKAEQLNTPAPPPEASKREPKRNEPPRAEPPKPTTAKQEAPKPIAQKSEAPKPEPPKPETPKPLTQKSETQKSETQKSETQKPETQKPETQKPETQKSEPARQERKTEATLPPQPVRPAAAQIPTVPIAPETPSTPAATAPVPAAPISTTAAPPVSTPPVSTPAAAVSAPSPPAPKTPAAPKPVATSSPAASPIDLTDTGASLDDIESAEPKKKSKKKKKVGATGSSSKKKKSNKARPAWFLPAIAGGGLFFVSILLFALTKFSGSGDSDEPQPPKVVGTDPTGVIQPPLPSSDNKPAPAPRDPVNDKFTLVRDDATLPWAPPTSGEPISLDMLPPEAQIWLHWKPAKFEQDPQGQQLLSVLEADFAPVKEYLTTRAGTSLDNISEILAAFYPGKEGRPEIAIRFTLSAELALSDLKLKWGNLQEAKSGKATIFTNDRGEAYFISLDALSDTQKYKSFTVGPQKRIEELVALDGGLPPLRRQLEQLQRTTDSSADLTVLFAPGFLFTDGRQILTSSVPAARATLAEVLATDMQAGLLTTTLKPNWYTELRLIGNSDLDATRIAKDLNTRLTTLPDTIESRINDRAFDPSWGKLSVRYPQMLRELIRQLRVNVEDGQAIGNFYLPKVAAPNLIVASWLAAHSDAGKSLVAAKDNTPADQPTLTPEQFLDRPIKLSFDQESLEISLQSIAEATADGLPANQPKLAMELDYTSMEKDGITQNQQIRQFMHNGKPLREVLTDLVKRANPTPGIQDTTSAELKFIWILVDAADKPGGKKILLTTRAYVNEKKLPLSKEFAMPQ
jgi:serine/threonine protein kinase